MPSLSVEKIVLGVFVGHCCFCDCFLPDIPGACSTVVACRERTLTNFLAGVSGCIATVCGVLLAFVFACKARTIANFLAGVSVPKGTATANVFAGVSVLCWYVFACRARTLTNCLADVSGCIATVCGVLLASVFAFKDRTTANFLAGVSVLSC